METIRSSMDQAMALQLRLSDCQRILYYATDFANERWVDTQSCFMDVESHSGEVNIVNTSTAISVIGRCSNIFDLKTLTPYSHLDFGNVCKFYRDSYLRPEKCWPSKQTHTWTPYVTSYVVGAIARAAFLANSANFVRSIDKDRQLNDILSHEIRRLIEFLDKWAFQNLRDPDLADYDHVYFAYTALEALDTLFKELGRAGSSLIPDNLQKDLIERVVPAAIHRFRLEFYSQMTYKLADLPQHLSHNLLF